MIAEVVLLRSVAGVQIYDTAPPWEAFSVALPFKQIEVSLISIKNTSTLTVSLFIQPLPSMPVTVYVVGLVGNANVVGLNGLLNVAAGSHEYEVAPVAVKLAESPLQMLTLTPASTSGN